MKKISIILSIMVLVIFSVDLSGQTNTNLGSYAGNSGSNNTSIGYYAGDDVTGNENTFLGANSGLNVTSGYKNLFLGYLPGYAHTTGSYNILGGWKAGFYNYTGVGNIIFGMESGFSNNGSLNVFVGHAAGRTNTGSSNVFLGSRAGYYETGSNKLYIENSNDTLPLIYGEFDNNMISINNRLGIGIKSFPTDISLMVNGTIKAKEVIITTDGFPDYVFKPEYKLLPLENLEAFINENGHLPDIPSEEMVKKEGINVGELEKLLLKKVEEQTLYLIELSKEIKKIKQENESLRREISSAAASSEGI